MQTMPRSRRNKSEIGSLVAIATVVVAIAMISGVAWVAMQRVAPEVSDKNEASGGVDLKSVAPEDRDVVEPNVLTFPKWGVEIPLGDTDPRLVAKSLPPHPGMTVYGNCAELSHGNPDHTELKVATVRRHTPGARVPNSPSPYLEFIGMRFRDLPGAVTLDGSTYISQRSADLYCGVETASEEEALVETFAHTIFPRISSAP